jgi:hypothetical protein
MQSCTKIGCIAIAATKLPPVILNAVKDLKKVDMDAVEP